MPESALHKAKHHHAHGNLRQTFIESAKTAAQQSEKMTGVPASITLAQVVLESGWGKHHIGSANNYFGVKFHGPSSAQTGWALARTKEYDRAGNVMFIMARFKKYPSMADSFIDHGLFLKNNHRYAKLLENYQISGNADEFAKGLQAAHYGTDPDYAKLLISLMKRYDLYQYNLKRAVN